MRLSHNDVFVSHDGTQYKLTRIVGKRVEAVTRRGTRGNFTKSAVVVPRSDLVAMSKVA